MEKGYRKVDGRKIDCPIQARLSEVRLRSLRLEVYLLNSYWRSGQEWKLNCPTSDRRRHGSARLPQERENCCSGLIPACRTV